MIWNRPLYNHTSGKATVENVHVKNSELSRFFQKYLMQRATSIFKITVPKNWNKYFFTYTLFPYGFVGVCDTAQYGVVPLFGKVYGEGLFYQPTNFQVENPAVTTDRDFTIGSGCEIIRLQPDYNGILDLVVYYADMMALCAQTAGVNLVNSKLSWVLFAENKSLSQSLKTMYDEIASGNPVVVVDKNLRSDDGSTLWEQFTQNVSQNYIAGQVLEDLRKIEQRFNTAVGIPNANTEKKERLIRDEVNANNVETMSNCTVWFEQLQEDFQRVREVFGFTEQELSVEWRFKPEVMSNADD